MTPTPPDPSQASAVHIYDGALLQKLDEEAGS